MPRPTPSSTNAAHASEADVVIGLGVEPRRLVATLAVGALVVSILGVVGQWMRYKLGVVHSFGFVGQFDPDGEGNFSTWYSSTLLLAAAAMFETVARRSARLARSHARNWRLMAVLLMLMAADETAQVHEMFVGPLRATLGARGLLYFTWVIPGALLAVVVLLASLRFLRDLPRDTRGMMLLGAAVYLAGALGMEMLDGCYASHFGEHNFRYSLLTSIEELLEMAGTVLLADCAAMRLRSLTAAPVRAGLIGALGPASVPASARHWRTGATSDNSAATFRREPLNTSGR